MIDNVIYWAVKLDDASKGKLLSAFPPKHAKVYAEHMTIAFGPTKEINEELEPMLGKPVNLLVLAHYSDDKGQAVVVSGFDRYDSEMPHVTISTAPDTKPVYSNQLTRTNNFEHAAGPSLTGKVMAFTKKGWR
jgi:hypothetical protein